MSKIYHKGDIVFLYVRFLKENGDYATCVKNAKVRILHEHNENIYEDLEWTEMNQLSSTEYFYNYNIPYDSDCGMFDIIYYGEIDDKPATMIESFHVINKSEQYTNAIKLYGYINDDINNMPLSGVSIEIQDVEQIYLTQSFTKENGYWESFIYPGEYICSFKKQGFNEQIINIQVGDENNEIQFNNISLESTRIKTCGNGAYEITDSYVLKNGIPLDGLVVKAFDVTNPQEVVATDITDNKGVWKIFLDSGFYFLKVNGISMNNEFDKTFRLNVADDGKYTLDDMNDNKAVIRDECISSGNGPNIYSDIINDRYGNPIVDVQVNAYQNGKIVAQCYTNIMGKYELHLESGEYMIDIYHPSFKEIAEFKINI